MARNKYPEITVSRILEVSFKLFSERGYNQVKMQDIVDELGDLTKGAVYHHFKNKEDIFDAILENKYYIVLKPIDEVQKSNLNGLEKFKKIISLGLKNSIQNKDVVHLSDGLLKTPRFLLRQMDINQNKVAPIIQHIIEEGNKDGSLNVLYPKQASECFSLLVNIWLNPSIYSTSEEEYIKKIYQFKILLDAIGLPVITEHIIEEFKKLQKVSI